MRPADDAICEGGPTYYGKDQMPDTLGIGSSLTQTPTRVFTKERATTAFRFPTTTHTQAGRNMFGFERFNS